MFGYDILERSDRVVPERSVDMVPEVGVDPAPDEPGTDPLRVAGVDVVDDDTLRGLLPRRDLVAVQLDPWYSRPSSSSADSSSSCFTSSC